MVEWKIWPALETSTLQAGIKMHSFYYNDKVMIKKGFWRGCTGTLISYEQIQTSNGFFKDVYFVRLDNQPQSAYRVAKVMEAQMEKIK